MEFIAREKEGGVLAALVIGVNRLRKKGCAIRGEREIWGHLSRGGGGGI